jgi:DNA topoisomerase-1
MSNLSSDFAQRAGLHYCHTTDPRHGFRRMPQGKSFYYLNPRGARVRDSKTLERIRKLAIPPAYREVWIAVNPQSHLQFVGVDARGRKQYRYHAAWTEIKKQSKFDRVLKFAHTLPRIRKVTRAHLLRPGLPKEKVLATVVQLLEKTLIRIGNDEYAKQNHSYGLATLHNEHVKVQNQDLIFRFKGKSNIHHEISLHDRRLATIVKECRELPGQELFQYLDATGENHRIHSNDVNAYLKEVAGHDFTAKDFRTWGGTVFAAIVFSVTKKSASAHDTKRKVNQAIEVVAQRLGNTKTVCRKSYIHPAVIHAYSNGMRIPVLARKDFALAAKQNWEELQSTERDERGVLNFLRKHADAFAMESRE